MGLRTRRRGISARRRRDVCQHGLELGIRAQESRSPRTDQSSPTACTRLQKPRRRCCAAKLRARTVSMPARCASTRRWAVEEPKRLVPALAVEGIMGTFPPLVVPGTARDLVWVGDVVDAYLLAARTKDTRSRVRFTTSEPESRRRSARPPRSPVTCSERGTSHVGLDARSVVGYRPLGGGQHEDPKRARLASEPELPGRIWQASHVVPRAPRCPVLLPGRAWLAFSPSDEPRPCHDRASGAPSARPVPTEAGDAR